ncbi:putative transcription elongation factor s-II [Trypanosoma cruzi]|uniref:Transcription elongation factor S-II, putative n=2 Tax=Trypanosoma cruzi TaxID=5693 RepID=Q4CXN7_TRYCC|nr:transcription elongation factor S-II, putative [Trypanosoma cruzi]EAN85041.1 transcription elongation factor S-II, putative [Trypanosoma cruzi]PWV06693.1 putative transcription elongation factor s-II [Trypanosoma cruzi]|eukprot:XP_806892.1 transcription elongation factor S-II [Trypanosoma cruzi strain CL Brener]
MVPYPVYEPFDRVWVKMEGYDWWPARIVSDEELRANGQSRAEGCDITVYFYEGTTTPASLEHFKSATTSITFFETSSEKAVTADADLLAAIRRAETDETANPLKYEFAAGDRGSANKTGDGVAAGAAAVVTATGASVSSTDGMRRGTGNAAANQRPVSKRSRAAELEERHVAAPALNLLRDEKLIEIAGRINEAVSICDLPSLRIELCDLDTVSVTVRQLETTKIGVAVGSILGRKELEKLWPLSRAIISSWARAMPVETIEAIKRHQQYRLGKRQDDANKSSTMELSMMSPLAAGAPSFADVNDVSGPLASRSVENGERVRMRFVHRVRKLLDNPTDPPIPGVTSSDLEAVAEELCRDVVEPEDRKHLQEQLEKPGMTQLRRSLATRAMSGKEFLKLPRSALMTEDERRMEEARITKMIEEQEKLKLANVSVTSLFKCPNCGKNRCSYYEQQTRSADEPTTKFVTCLECKYVWTTE